jgi:hypothetical protein
MRSKKKLCYVFQETFFIFNNLPSPNYSEKFNFTLDQQLCNFIFLLINKQIKIIFLLQRLLDSGLPPVWASDAAERLKSWVITGPDIEALRASS